MKLAEYSIARPVTMGMLTLSMVVLGFLSLQRLPLEQLPAISSSGITVQATYPSAAPEEIEQLVSLPLEQTLATLNNVEQISASSSRNRASVRVDFKSGTDMDLANMEVRDRVDQARGLLPDDLDRISIMRWQSDSMPIIYVSMAWRGDDDRLFEIAEKVVEPRLLRLDGVANVEVQGMDEKQLIVELDQERLEAHDVSLNYLTGQMRGNNINVSLGRVMDGQQRYQVRALGEFQELEQIGDLPLGDSRLSLQDMGRVNYDYPEKKDFQRLNGADAVTVEIYKSSTANVVEVAALARQVLAEIEREYGADLDLEIIRDRSDDVMREVDNLSTSAVLGGILAVGIIFLFLRNIRSTLVIGIAIPVSVFCVFVGMYVARTFFGSTITLNMVSLMGLMLAVGMLVDPAVVALESIFRKRQEEGLEARQAALSGSREIGMAVVASALTTMCVFVPFFFLSAGRMTTWMRDAGLTICLAILVSMIISLTLVPLATSRLFANRFDRFDPWLKSLVLLAIAATAGWQVYSVGWSGTLNWAADWTGRVGASLAGIQWQTGATLALALLAAGLLLWRFKRHGMRQSYVSLLGWTLQHRLVGMGAAVLLLASGIYLFTQIEQQGMPWTATRQVDITIETDRSYSLEEVRQIFAAAEDSILSRKDRLDVESVSTNFSQRGGQFTARLVDADDGRLSTMEASRAIQGYLPQKVGVNYKVGRQRSWSGPQLGVEVQLKGIDPDVLAVLANEVQIMLAQLPGVIDVDTSLEDGEEEIQVAVNRDQAQEYGLSPREVASTIGTALGSRRTSTFKAEEREIDIVLQLEEADRVDLEQLKNNRFEGRNGSRIQLATVADFRVQPGPTELKREDRQLTLTVFANTKDRSGAFRLMGPIQGMMDGMALPSGYSWSLGRAARWMQQDTQDNTFTLIFAVLLIYLIMASLFESLIHPFTILLAIPFSLIGVSVGLYAMEIPLDANGMLGLLILFGIVVNNGIVLVDHINHYRREGMDRHQAILRGGQNRMRPIMMTAFTTILNLMPLVLPMIYGTSEGFARRWGPVGLVVVCGLASSTLLTLIFAPMLYSLLDDLAHWTKRVARAV
ncbi:MAG: MMPL family transporter [Candidatus Latescibacteria bacterium]|nr:MMPL family transporter [Candidatus Latescibacterota bacterium]